MFYRTYFVRSIDQAGLSHGIVQHDSQRCMRYKLRWSDHGHGHHRRRLATDGTMTTLRWWYRLVQSTSGLRPRRRRTTATTPPPMWWSRPLHDPGGEQLGHVLHRCRCQRGGQYIADGDQGWRHGRGPLCRWQQRAVRTARLPDQMSRWTV